MMKNQIKGTDPTTFKNDAKQNEEAKKYGKMKKQMKTKNKA